MTTYIAMTGGISPGLFTTTEALNNFSVTFATPQVVWPEYEIVNFGFGISLWRDKKTGFVRHPPKQVAS